MRPRAHSELESSHPLFRALVLMGGSIALGCGGSVVVDSSAAGSGGKVTIGGASPGGTSQGGAAATAGTIMSAGGGGSSAINTGGGGNSAIDAGAQDCPPAQWDCSSLGTVCGPNFSGSGRPAGCVCDLTRPKSVADCGSNEDLICLRGYASEPDPNTWDTALHYQCACVPGPPVPSSETCGAACQKTYLTSDLISCSLPPDESCDASNNCTATAANVLRQDGITCGCAPILLK